MTVQYSCALHCVSGNLSLFMCLKTSVILRALFSRATTTQVFDFWVLVSDQHSTLPIGVASLFALGI